MTFNEADVRHYLNIVQDDNPHHPKNSARADGY